MPYMCSSVEDFTKVISRTGWNREQEKHCHINETIFWLSQDGVYAYSAREIMPISFTTLGRLDDG
jgi:hypothetical protein